MTITKKTAEFLPGPGRLALMEAQPPSPSSAEDEVYMSDGDDEIEGEKLKKIYCIKSNLAFH